MTLEEFIAECKADIDRFHANWVKGMATYPDHYPKTLTPEEWYEQLPSFLSSESLK